MDRDRLIDELPNGLAAALRLHEAGEPDSVVATALGVPEESVPVLLQVALAKLEHLDAGAESAVVDSGTAAPDQDGSGGNQ